MINMSVQRLYRFIFVGIINTIFGTSVMFCLYNFLGFSYWISSAANYIFGSILSYILNKRFTFRHKGGVMASGVKFAVNIVVCYFIAYGAAKPAVAWLAVGASVNMRENIAMFTGMCIFTGLNYLGQRFFVFGGKIMDHKRLYEKWVNSPHLDDSDKKRLLKMSDEEIYEAFYKRLSFGTAGMRGIMGLGANRINKYTIRMAAKGLADLLGEGSKVAIAYDTRNNSKYFAQEAARVLAAANIKAFIFDRYSPVPLLSFAVRNMRCDGGIVITASHNMPVYNGFKVYDSTGCQLDSSLAHKISESVENMKDELDVAVADLEDCNISYIGQDVVDRFMDAVLQCRVQVDEKAMDALKIVYTPIHGSGRDYVLETLKRCGFGDVTLVCEQADYNGDFPTVKKPNPEEKAVFHIAEKIAMNIDADVIIGTDPDSDRVGVGIRHNEEIVYLSGNQIGVLFADFLGRMRPSKGKFLITSIVTGDMGPDVAESYGVSTIRTFTGFKDLAAEMNKLKDSEIFMAYEESYGYLLGTHIRDKDGISSSMLMCQMAAYWKQKGFTLIDVLNQLSGEYGYYIDDQSSFVFEGAKGAEKISAIMRFLRNKGESVFSDIEEVKEVLDYSKGAEGLAEANVLKYIFRDGSWLAVRPSGTEPKIKFYCCVKGNDRLKSADIHDKLKDKVKKLTDEI